MGLPRGFRDSCRFLEHATATAGSQVSMLGSSPARAATKSAVWPTAGHRGEPANREDYRRANGVNPIDYLADVLLRVQIHPASRTMSCWPTTGRRQVGLTSGGDLDHFKEELDPRRYGTSDNYVKTSIPERLRRLPEGSIGGV